MSKFAYNQSMDAIQAQLARIMKASQVAQNIRACFLGTHDRDHALNLLKEVFGHDTASGAIALYHFTSAAKRYYQSGARGWDIVGQGPNDVLTLLQDAQQISSGGVVILEDCLPFLADEKGDQRVRMLLSQMLSTETKSVGLVLVFIEAPQSEKHLPSILSDQFVRLIIPYPRIDELRSIARREIALIAHHTKTPMPAETIKLQGDRLATELVGLSRSAAKDAMQDALSSGPENFDTAYRLLTIRKKEQLSRDLAMNVLETSTAEEPVGLDNLVDYLRITQQNMQITGPGRARGILLIGPPGTGKTMLARAIGRLVGLPVVEFRISSLMNSLLGETERRFAQAFQTLAAMSPNVVFIDEIEKAFGDSSERDGGTMMRCTGALLSWLSDNPYPNYIVATSNSLRRMGEIGLTMTRSERFDAAFFVDVPGTAARRQMLEQWLNGYIEQPSEIAATLAGLTGKFSGADLRSVVKQAVFRARSEQQPLTIARLESEIKRKQARVIALYDEFRELRQWGLRYCDPASSTQD
ncbi:ATP-binding protein [Nitrosomonas sp. wSCUT-2]